MLFVHCTLAYMCSFTLHKRVIHDAFTDIRVILVLICWCLNKLEIANITCVAGSFYLKSIKKGSVYF